MLLRIPVQSRTVQMSLFQEMSFRAGSFLKDKLEENGPTDKTCPDKFNSVKASAEELGLVLGSVSPAKANTGSLLFACAKMLFTRHLNAVLPDKRDKVNRVGLDAGHAVPEVSAREWS